MLYRRVKGEDVLIRRHLQPFHHALGQCNYIRRLTMKFQASCLQAGDIEQVFGKLDQASGGLVDALEGFQLPIDEFGSFAVCGLHDQHLRKPLQNGKRRTQFVGGDADELVFESFCFF